MKTTEHGSNEEYPGFDGTSEVLEIARTPQIIMSPRIG